MTSLNQTDLSQTECTRAISLGDTEKNSRDSPDNTDFT